MRTRISRPAPAVVAGATLLLVFGTATTARAQATQATASAPALDSIVLERTPCFGRCPAYRLSVAADGAVHFQSRNLGDSALSISDSIQASAVAWLQSEVDRQSVRQLPPVIANDRTLCPDRATDHPTAIVSLFERGSAYSIVDYHGCFLRSDHATAGGLAGLRRFEAAIDSVTGSARWVRPNRFARGAASATPLSAAHQAARSAFEDVFVRGIGQRDTAAVLRSLAPQLVLHIGANALPVPRDQFWALIGPITTAFPDIAFSVDRVVAEGDWAAAGLTFRGTHRAPWHGIPATGRSVSVTETFICRLEQQRLRECWQQWDEAGLRQQLIASP